MNGTNDGTIRRLLQWLASGEVARTQDVLDRALAADRRSRGADPPRPGEAALEALKRLGYVDPNSPKRER